MADAEPPPRVHGAAAEVLSPAGVTNRPDGTAGVRPSAVAADAYSAGTLARWTASRKRVLGRRLVLAEDPEAAAVQLAEALGGRAAAFRWALALVAECGR